MTTVCLVQQSIILKMVLIMFTNNVFMCNCLCTGTVISVIHLCNCIDKKKKEKAGHILSCLYNGIYMYNVGITNHHFTIFYLYLCIPYEISLSIIYLFCEKSEPFLISSRKYVFHIIWESMIAATLLCRTMW